MNTLLECLTRSLDDPSFADAGVIQWSSPVPVFGNPGTSNIATLGINPSNREFVDPLGQELDGMSRRFHTLKSLGLRRWADARQEDLRLVGLSCLDYFRRYPYDAWFKRLEYIIGGTGATYYGRAGTACHLDLVPYATARKWTTLRTHQRSFLLRASCDVLGELLRDSAIEVLVLNGRFVITEFKQIAALRLNTIPMSDWTLPRQGQPGIQGSAEWGMTDSIGSVRLGRSLLVLGFNHNIQSSFGVTKEVLTSIRRWVTEAASKALSARARIALRSANPVLKFD